MHIISIFSYTEDSRLSDRLCARKKYHNTRVIHLLFISSGRWDMVLKSGQTKVRMKGSLVT